MKITFLADKKAEAMKALRVCIRRYGQTDLVRADVVVVLGGDGFMLKTLHALLNYQTPVFGLNLGHVGYLLNNYSLNDLPDRVDAAERREIVPLRINAESLTRKTKELFAFNEVSIQRSSPQAARLNVVLTDEKDGKGYANNQEVFGDGIIVATKLGSHGYYNSANGNPMKNNDDVIGVQAICSKSNFNRIMTKNGHACIVPREVMKRPVHMDKDGQERLTQIQLVAVENAPEKVRTLLIEKQKGMSF